ncbi:MAG: sulfite exporter TauE/SafE family protein [Chloroflexi bacterium]|nr:sulfite exporter TauE/SafE family protein [Chloroflexota bacterium]
MTELLVLLVVFFAIFTQSVTGFGLGLVSMPFLTQILGINEAAPLVALIAITAEALLLIRYREHLNLQAVWRLSLASIISVPLGVIALHRLDGDLILKALGAIVIGYSLYSLSNFRLPEVEHPRWGYGFGFLSGLLSGAYNLAGPPVVIYGNCRRWEPREFKSNLQGFFMLNSVIVILTHALSQHYNRAVFNHYLLAIPAILLGIGVGLSLDHRINPVTFRKIVLVLLVVLGLTLIF